MAHDVSEFLMYVAENKAPDQKVMVMMMLTVTAIMYPVSYLFTKFHYVNCYSHRFEMYAVKGSGYKKFREKMFRTHKTPGNWLGAYS